MSATHALIRLCDLLPAAESVAADGDLLRAFAERRDEAAFAELVRRHGSLVFGVCRRLLGSTHAAEDAFQATFLILARRASKLASSVALAGWLHCVAVRTARDARRSAIARLRREADCARPELQHLDDRTWRDVRQLLDAELARLPERYRLPLILCYLEDLPQSEAASRLGVSLPAFRGRLERGRLKLRRRLQQFGLPLAAPLLLIGTEAVPAAVRDATVATIRDAFSGKLISPVVRALAGGSTWFAKWKIAAVAACFVAVIGVALGRGKSELPANGGVPNPPAKVEDKTAVDALGDPLPPGSLKRLGTRRHRVQDWPLTWQSLPDGKSYLAHQRSSNRDEIRRIDSDSGLILETWPIPDKHHAVGYSKDGRYLLMSTSYIFYTGLQIPGQKYPQEWSLTLYDLKDRKTVWVNREQLEQRDWKQIDRACFSPDGKWVVTTGRYSQGAMRLWDAATGKELWHRENAQAMDIVGFTDGGNTVVCCSNSRSIYLFERATGKNLRNFPTVGEREFQSCTLSPDGANVLVGGYTPAIRVWELATGKEKAPLDGHKQWARRIAFTPDGKTLVTGGNDSFALVRDWPSGKAIRTIELGRTGVSDMHISGDGRRLEILFWGEQALSFFDLTTGKPIPALQDGHRANVYGIAVAPDGSLISYGRDATVRTWDLATGKVTAQIRVEQDLNAGGFALSRDGRFVAVARNAETVGIYERATGRLVTKIPAANSVMKFLVFSPDGRWLAACNGSDGRIQIWETATGRAVMNKKLPQVAYGSVACAFSADSRLFAHEDHGQVRFWDTATWTERPPLEKAYAPMGLAFSPDGRTIATASVEGIRVYETATHKCRAHIRPENYPGGPLLFSPSGRYLAWVNNHSTIHVWDTRRDELLPPFHGHDDGITGLAFTADDRAIASSSADSTILLWDIATAAAKLPAPQSGDVAKAWMELADPNAEVAFKAIRVLLSSPEAAVKIVGDHLKPAVTPDVKQIDQHLRDLDSTKFAERDRAMRELEQFGDRAGPNLERFLAGSPSAEARRRAEQLLAKAREPFRDGQPIREWRAVEVLERIGDREATRLLEQLATGDTDARLTREAKAALRRLGLGR